MTDERSHEDANRQKEPSDAAPAATHARRGRTADTGKTADVGKTAKKNSDLEVRLEESEARATEYLDDLRRIQAEFENYKKRMIREQTQFLGMATADLMAKLLPVIDNLQRAVAATDATAATEEPGGAKKTGGAETSGESPTGDNGAAKLTEGIKLIYQQLMDVLAKEGLNTLNPLGETFDPMRHEAVMQEESEAHEEHTVLEVLQKGYQFKERVLRPAAVKVSVSGAASSQPERNGH